MDPMEQLAALQVQFQQLQAELHHLQIAQPANPPVQGPVPHSDPVAQLVRTLKPAPYSGMRSETSLDTWLFQLGQYFEAVHIQDDGQRIRVAGMLLAGQAAEWYRDLFQHHQYEQPLTWHAFEEAMKTMFQPLGREIHARDRLAVAVQRNKDSLSQYTAYMRSLFLSIPNISEDEKLDRYVRGLQLTLQKEVRPRQPSTFDEAVTMAMRFDALRGTMRDPVQHYTNRSNNQRTQHSHTDMEIDAMQTAEQKNNDKQKGKWRPQCYNCLKYGHFAKDCRSPRHPDADKRGKGNQGRGKPQRSNQ
jgi:Ty3 transposon capsid-like protein/Zinc knuckle